MEKIYSILPAAEAKVEERLPEKKLRLSKLPIPPEHPSEYQKW